MPKVSNGCIDLIKKLPNVEPDQLKDECLFLVKQKRSPSRYSIHMSKCLRQKADDRQRLFKNCVADYKKGG